MSSTASTTSTVGGMVGTSSPIAQGLLIGLVGPPGAGKSTFIKSAARAFGPGSLAVAVAPGREAVSYVGVEGAQVQSFEDEEWLPFLGKKEVGGFNRLLKWLYERRAEPGVRVVGVDTMTSAMDLAEHLNLKKCGAGDQTELRDKFQFYAMMKASGTMLTDVLSLVRASGKHVICTFHQDVKEIEGAGTATVVQDKEGNRRLQWEQGKVPALSGQIRETIAGKFDIWAYSERLFENGKEKYVLRVKGDERTPAKCALPIFNEARIPSDFAEVKKRVDAFLSGAEGAAGGQK